MEPKLSKEDHDILKRALVTHERITGEKTSHILDTVAVADPVADAAAEASRKQQVYDTQAKLNSRVEETQQAERQARAGAAAGTPPPEPAEGRSRKDTASV